MKGWHGYLAQGLEWIANPKKRRLLYVLTALLLTLLCFFPRPYVARAKLLPQDSSAAGLGQVLSTLGGQLQGFANLLGAGRAPNDLYLLIGRSDLVRQDVVKALKLAGPDAPYDSEDEAKIALDDKVDVQLLLGGVLEVQTKTFDAEDSLAITSAYLSAISNRIAALGRETIKRKSEIVERRYKDAQVRVAKAETALNDFRRQNRLAAPEAQLNSEIVLRAQLQASLKAKEVELEGLQQVAGPENVQLRTLEASIASLKTQIAESNRPKLESAGPSLAALSAIETQYINLFRDYKFAQTLFEVYTRSSEQVAVESLVAENATYIQLVEPTHLDAERQYNILAVGLLCALALLIVFTEIYVPMTGLSWSALFNQKDEDGE